MKHCRAFPDERIEVKRLPKVESAPFKPAVLGDLGERPRCQGSHLVAAGEEFTDNVATDLAGGAGHQYTERCAVCHGFSLQRAVSR